MPAGRYRLSKPRYYFPEYLVNEPERECWSVTFEININEGAWPGHETRWPLRASAPCRDDPGGATGARRQPDNTPGPEPPHPHNSGDTESCPGTPQERDVRQKTHDSPQADKAWQKGRSRVFGRPGTACRSGKKPAEQTAGTAGAVTTRIHLPTTPTNIRRPSTSHRETGRRSKGVRPLRQPGEEPGQRGRIEPLQNKNGITGGREALQHKRLTPTKINPQTSPPLNESTTMSDKDQPTTMDRILQEITTVSRRIEGMDASITSLTLETKSMRSDIAGFQSRVTGLEQRMGSLETQINMSQEREQDVLHLRSKLTDIEDRSRRDNIRKLGIPKIEDGSDMQAFLTSTLPKMISLDFDPPLEFQRAHRIGPKRSDNSSWPRPIIACLLRHNQTRQILQVARNHDPFRIDQHEIRITAD
ncbi:hypothetical protein NDU88_004546 [Pleurodeles waltl]|uniref:Uncharacterized protein n=1 Tax=Pleurodeles waltl TaxID=8319 RepID=A0AAV7W9E5_PLEWA|nr:hypothetical protein NDU88_004546 [Pleurodeles waltl]